MFAPAALQGQQAMQQIDANVAGTWIGSFDINSADGKTQHDTAMFVLAQNGAALTGSAGANEHQLTPIADGRVSGGDVHFSM
jgi:hypothetical protein